MSFTTPEPVVSGQPYPVTEVEGAPPGSLEQFVGETRFTVDLDGRPYEIAGVGGEQNASVRFHEKDVAHDGKDIRVWLVSRTAGGSFVAEQQSAY
ncbi:MAG: hypothetical protein ACLGIA_09975 [Actinomycetes bacterium]